MGQPLSVPEPGEIPAATRRWALGAEPSLAAVAALLKEGRARRVLVAVGAGISVSAGIPDFRPPGTNKITTNN